MTCEELRQELLDLVDKKVQECGCLECLNTHEMGEVVDMIKDCYEAEMYEREIKKIEWEMNNGTSAVKQVV